MGQQSPSRKNTSKNWLQYITEQSWEPELLISGLAIYATLKMPGLFEDAYNYYQYNLQAGSGIFDELLPLLIYSVFTTVAYVLAASFIVHFIIRAFWVGFIGLMSVYTDGIKYGDLPYSDLYKKEARKKLGTSERMALSLDGISSLIFSIAFSGVLIMIAVSILYLIFFLLYNVLKLFVSASFFDTYASILYYVFLVFAFGYIAAIYILNLKRFRSNPRLAQWHFNLSWNLNAIIMPVVYKPLQFIQLTFLSNISTRRFMAYYAILFVSFFGILLIVMLQTLNANIFDTRNYYATGSSARHVELHEYSTTVNEDDLLLNTVIEKPVISSGLMQAFIPYPKQLDEMLNQFCEPADVPDSVNTHQRRRRINQHNIDCAEQFFIFSVDDSVQLSGEMMFARHPVTGQRGYQTYLDVSGLATGRHIFTLRRKSITPADSIRRKEGLRLSFETEIPFWIEKQ